MKTTEIEDKIIKRKVGERVDVMFNIEQSTVKDLGNGAFSATVTTSDVDRMGESIDTQGITTEEYMKNPVVLYGHDYQGLPIGKATKVTQFKNKMVAQFQLAIAEYPFAATVAAMIKGGYLNAVSIGGIVTAWDETYTQILGMNMLEFSVVPVPANPNAVITASLKELTGKSTEVIAKEFHEFVNKTMETKLKSLDNNEIEVHIKTLKTLTAILEATIAHKPSEKEISNDSEKIILTIRKTSGQLIETGSQIIKLVKAKKVE
jgi:HK97 family phage prohead protease